MLKITYIAWDSDFFNLHIGKIKIKTIKDYNKILEQLSQLKNKYDLLYLFCPENIFISENENTVLVDQKVIYVSNIDSTNHYYPSEIKPYFENTTTPELLKLALESGAYSRYKTDKHFNASTFERLYTKWIENSINGTFADIVLCYYNDGRIIGMVTIQVKDNIGHIGLIAVDALHQNKGIGSALIIAAKVFLYNRNIKKLSVATQLNNMQACTLYKKNLFIVKSITNIYHFWL